jgi:hypothetical protein
MCAKLIEILRGRDHLGYLGIDGRIILKRITKMWTGLIGPRIWPRDGLC